MLRAILILLVSIHAPAFAAPIAKGEPNCAPLFDSLAVADSAAIDQIFSRIEAHEGMWHRGRQEPGEVDQILDQLIPFGFLHKSPMMGIGPERGCPGVPYFYFLDESEISRIISRPDFRLELAKGLLRKASLSPDFKSFGFAPGPATSKITESSFADELLRTARLIHAMREFEKIPIQPALTQEQFLRVAQIEELGAVQVPTVFRYDSRPPAIINEQGFLPNPAKPRGAISAHSNPASTGAQFVSVSKNSGNEFSLQSIGAGKLGQSVSLDQAGILRLNRLKAEAAANKWLPPGESPELKVLYEYRISDVTGVEPPQSGSLSGESEVILPFVPAESIKQYREVFLLVGKKLVTPGIGNPYVSSNSVVLAHEFGDWKPIR